MEQFQEVNDITNYKIRINEDVRKRDLECLERNGNGIKGPVIT